MKEAFRKRLRLGRVLSLDDLVALGKAAELEDAERRKRFREKALAVLMPMAHEMAEDLSMRDTDADDCLFEIAVIPSVGTGAQRNLQRKGPRYRGFVG